MIQSYADKLPALKQDASSIQQAVPVPSPASIEKSRVYLYSTSAGWSNNWSDFDQVWSGHADPSNPSKGCDMAWFFSQLGQKAAQMGVDGIVFTTPSAQSDTPAGDSDGWRMPFEGRIKALRAGSAIGDRTAITNGLLLLRQHFSGKVILYTGYPDDRDAAIVQDRDWCDGYVKASIGPYLDSGMIDAVVVDSVGDLWQRLEAKAVLSSIRRQYPKISLGGEPNPMNIAGMPFKLSLSSRQSEQMGGVFGTTRAQVGAGFSPTIVAYVDPVRVDLGQAMTELAAGRSVAILPWQVGYEVEPKPEDKEAWDAFMKSAVSLRS